jgi:hypothetical protein
MNQELRTKMGIHAAAFVAAFVFSGVAVGQNCQTVTGTVSRLEPFTPCPAGFLGCFQGKISGDLSGTFTSGLTDLMPVDAHTIRLGARTTITTTRGIINTADTGFGFGCVTGTAVCQSSTEILAILSGTRAYSQASGSVILKNVGFTQTGTYDGEICNASQQQGPSN